MIGLIWAQARDGVIGDAGGIPWSLPEDQRRFRTVTAGSAVLMGRRTWESLPDSVRPLPTRRNIVVSRDSRYRADGAEVVTSVPEGLRRAEGRDVWVMGGAAIYTDALPLADALEITELDITVAGDTHAPAIPPSWCRAEEGEWMLSAGGLRYRFLSYRRDGETNAAV